MNGEVSQHGAEDWKIRKPVDKIAGDADMFDVPNGPDYKEMGIGDKTDPVIMKRKSASQDDLAEIEDNRKAGEEEMAGLKRDEYAAIQREFDAANAKKDNK